MRDCRLASSGGTAIFRELQTCSNYRAILCCIAGIATQAAVQLPLLGAERNNNMTLSRGRQGGCLRFSPPRMSRDWPHWGTLTVHDRIYCSVLLICSLGTTSRVSRGATFTDILSGSRQSLSSSQWETIVCCEPAETGRKPSAPQVHLKQRHRSLKIPSPCLRSAYEGKPGDCCTYFVG